MKIKNLLLTIFVLALLSCTTATAQRINKIGSRCSNTSLFFSQILANNVGDLVHTPCAGRASIFNGIVDFSGATIIPGGGIVTGTGTTNFVPRWTNGAGSVIGNTPFSWNGTVYNWDGTALNCTFCMAFTPSSVGAGVFQVGNTSASVIADDTANQVSLGGTSGIVVNSYGSSTTIGDTTGAGNSTVLTINDTSQNASLNSAATLFVNNIKPVAAAGGTIGSVFFPFTSNFIGNAANNTVQLTGTFTGNRVATFPDATGTVLLSTSVGAASSTFLASNYTNATAAFTNTALSLTLTAGKTYGFGCQVFASNSTAADGFQIDFAGGSATATTFIAGSNSALVTGTTSTLAGTFSNATLTGTNLIQINGTIVVNAGGTFILRGAEVAHTAGTLTFLTGSRCQASLLN